MTILHLPNEEAREMLVEMVIDERNAIRYVLLNEPEMDEGERQDLVDKFNTLGQIFDLKTWQDVVDTHPH